MNRAAVWFARCFAAALLGAGWSAGAWAQEAYPSKAIRIVSPFPAGGSLDILSRLIGSKLTETWKVPVLVESRPGANTMIAAEHVAKSPPDGYTLLVCIESTLVMNQFLYAKIPYDPLKDFAPITLATTQPLVLAANPALGVNNVPELIALAKAKPGQLFFGYGVTFNQLAGEAFTAMANVQMTGVGYKGAAPALQDVISGNIALTFSALSSAMANIKSGHVKALAVTSAKRSPALPDVPALAETLPGYDMPSWAGYVAPAGVSNDIVVRLHREFTRILDLPDVKSRLAAVGQEVVATETPEEFARLIRSESQKFERAIKAAGIKVQ
jgi:tripartite-type tricarboxylate transporter receptor subunit TctC